MKDESVIPEGSYCYTYVNGKQVNCPYWERFISTPAGVWVLYISRHTRLGGHRWYPPIVGSDKNLRHK